MMLAGIDDLGVQDIVRTVREGDGLGEKMDPTGITTRPSCCIGWVTSAVKRVPTGVLTVEIVSRIFTVSRVPVGTSLGREGTYVTMPASSFGSC
jgi:hypothetical protein